MQVDLFTQCSASNLLLLILMEAHVCGVKNAPAGRPRAGSSLSGYPPPGRPLLVRARGAEPGLVADGAPGAARVPRHHRRVVLLVHRWRARSQAVC